MPLSNATVAAGSPISRPWVTKDRTGPRQRGDEEWVERLATSYLWKFTDTSNFRENFSVVHGSTNTLSQSSTAITANLAGSFALSLSYT